MNIGVIGFGHLGKALVKGLLHNNYIAPENIYITARTEETRRQAISAYGINTCTANAELIANADVIFISVPSKVFFSEFADDTPKNTETKFFISLMAGVTLQQLKEVLGETNIIRAMPNLGMERNNGIIGYTQTDNVQIIELFQHLGYAFPVNEADIEKVTAFASCGIGFAAYILNCFLETGKELGFSKDASQEVVKNIFQNALQTDDYAQLVTAVATKGGATEAGVKSLEEDGVKDRIASAVDKAYRKMQ